ncbi:MAG: hypothetical protein WAO35_16400 [Terriglobia bacterium]
MKVCGKEIRVQGTWIRIARLEADKYEFLDEPEAMLSGLRNCGRRIDLFTFMQRLTETSPKYTYPWEWDNLAVLPVTTFDHWWTQQIRFAPRGRVRQAGKKGVTVREVQFDDVLVRGIWEIYNECPIRQGKRFPHYGMSIERAREYAGTFLDGSIFLGAFLGERLIGFAKLTCDENRTQANLMHILSKVEHRDKAPTNALLAQAVRSVAERQIPFLVYQNFSYGKGRQDSLSKFKEVNGFLRIDLPRYYVPLTRLGSVAFRLGLHHRFAERFPESVAAKFRELRTLWYNHKFQSSTEAS